MRDVMIDCWRQDDFINLAVELYTQLSLSSLVHFCNQEVCHSLNIIGERTTEITKIKFKVVNGSNTINFFLTWCELNGVGSIQFHNALCNGTNEHAIFEFEEFDLLSPRGDIENLCNVILQDVLRVLSNPAKEFKELRSGGRKRILSLVE